MMDFIFIMIIENVHSILFFYTVNCGIKKNELVSIWDFILCWFTPFCLSVTSRKTQLSKLSRWCSWCQQYSPRPFELRPTPPQWAWVASPPLHPGFHNKFTRSENYRKSQSLFHPIRAHHSSWTFSSLGVYSFPDENKSHHTSPIFIFLLWLPIKCRIKFENAPFHI